jgi:hypothetical protein
MVCYLDGKILLSPPEDLKAADSALWFGRLVHLNMCPCFVTRQLDMLVHVSMR